MALEVLIFTNHISAFRIDYLRYVRHENVKVIKNVNDLCGLIPADVLVIKKIYHTQDSIVEKDNMWEIQRHLDIKKFNLIEL